MIERRGMLAETVSESLKGLKLIETIAIPLGFILTMSGLGSIIAIGAAKMSNRLLLANANPNVGASSADAAEWGSVFGALFGAVGVVVILLLA